MTTQEREQQLIISAMEYEFNYSNPATFSWDEQYNKFIQSDAYKSIPKADELTTTIRIDTDDFCGVTFDMPVTNCCGIGPIINENYCPNCGSKIIKNEN